MTSESKHRVWSETQSTRYKAPLLRKEMGFDETKASKKALTTKMVCGENGKMGKRENGNGSATLFPVH